MQRSHDASTICDEFSSAARRCVTVQALKTPLSQNRGHGHPASGAEPEPNEAER
jgi:hypothetical protein